MSAFHLLLNIFLLTLAVYYVQFFWKRRHLYQQAKRFPGPFSLPFIGSALSLLGDGGVTDSIDKLFFKYGSVVRFWFGHKLVYLISDPKYFEMILNYNKNNALAKDELYNTMAGRILGNGLFTATVSNWKNHRKLIAPTFGQKILNGFVEVFCEQSEILLKNLEQLAGKTDVDIFPAISRCNLDFVLETAMGVSIGAQLTENDFTIWTEKTMELTVMRAFNLFYHPDVIFSKLPIGKEYISVSNKLRQFTKQVIIQKKQKYKKLLETNNGSSDGDKNKVFLDFLMDQNFFTEDDLVDEVLTFIIAGSDTSATAICYVLTLLGMDQGVQEKVYEEVLECIGSEKKVECSDLTKFKYMERVIKESLRLFSVPYVAREVGEDIVLDDCVFAKGTTLFFALRNLHYNPNYWPNPYKFDPDRFLPEEVAKRHPCAFLPFFYGPRNCIGFNYAMMAMKVIIATVIRKFKVFTCYKCVEEIKVKANIVVRPKDGYKVSLESRN